jgi:hypothetical protein
LSIQT